MSGIRDPARDAALDPAADPTGDRGIPVSDLLKLPAFANAQVVAGHGGLDRVVSCANIMEVPDIEPWVKPHELLLTTGLPPP